MAPASLWENIRKKIAEGKNYRPAKPGDKDRPTPEALKRAQRKVRNSFNFERILRMENKQFEDLNTPTACKKRLFLSLL